MFENVNLQGIQNTNLDSSSSAVLWIMSPRRYSQQVKRPLTYNFNGAFVDQADSAVARMAEQQNKTGIQSLVSSPHWLQAIFPSAHGHLLDMRPMEHSWTFMLVVNNDKSGAGGHRGLIRTMSDNQHLYYGYFIDEPVNPVNHGRVTFNPNAMMVITHKTLINKTNMVGTHGTNTRTDVMADVDVIHPSLMGTLTGASTSMLRPEDLYASTTDEDPNIIMHSEAALLERQGEPIIVGAKLGVPRHNVEIVLSAVASARGSMNAAVAAGEMGALGLGRDTFRDLVDDNLKDNSRLTEMGLATHQSISLGTIMHRYSARIEVAQQDHLPRYSPIDQSIGSARNTFSSMLTTVVPALMTEFKLLEIAFYYDSHSQMFRLFEEAPPATLVPMSDADTKFMLNGFIYRLTAEVLPILKLNHGDFHLQMQCSAGGVTHINLNFLDDAIRSNEVFEVPTILGGLNSALVGMAPVFDHNARELHSLINELVETQTDKPPMRIYDERHFDQSLVDLSPSPGMGHDSPTSFNPPSPHNRWAI